MLAAVIFPSDKFSVPPKDRIRRKDTADVPQQSSTQFSAPDRQATALVTVEEYPSLAKLLAQDLVLLHQVIDDILLLAVDPASQHHK